MTPRSFPASCFLLSAAKSSSPFCLCPPRKSISIISIHPLNASTRSRPRVNRGDWMTGCRSDGRAVVRRHDRYNRGRRHHESRTMPLPRESTMTQELLRYLLPIALGVVSSTSVHGADANELLVFISAFDTGDGGGIYAYRLQVDTGRLEACPSDNGRRSTLLPGPVAGTESSCIQPMRRGNSGEKRTSKWPLTSSSAIRESSSS